MTLRLTIILFSLILSKTYLSQLDSIHWIPPVHCTCYNITDQYLYLSTPSTIPFNVTIKDGAGNVLATPSIAKGLPFIYGVGTEMLTAVGELNNVMLNKGIIVEATSKFYANYRVKIPSQAGSLTAKGWSGKGKQFRIGLMPNYVNSGSRNNFFSIMATEDNTVVTVSDYNPAIVFNGTTTFSAPTLNFTLNKGETYTASCNQNVAVNGTGILGGLISSDKDVVVNTGNFLGALNTAASGQDVGVDQIVPVDIIGKEYISIEGEGSAVMEQVLVVAHQNNTEVFINGAAIPFATLNAGDWTLVDNSFYQGVGHRNMFIETSKPAYSFQFLGGSASSATPGMNILAPLSCKLPYNIDEMSDVDKIGTQVFTGGVFVVTRAGANVNINGALQVGAEPVLGNPNWETYKVSGLTGNVSITSDQNLIGGIFGVNGAAGWAGYFSGFDTEPVKVALATVDSCGFVELTTDTTYDTYEWFLDGSLHSGISDTNIVFQSGDYKVIMTRNNGCQDSALINDVVVYNKPVSEFTIDDDCLYNTALFNNTSSVLGGDTIFQNLWNFGDALTPTQTQSTEVNPEYNYFQSGTYDVTLIVETENGCQDTSVVTTVRFPVPIPNFYASNACTYDSVIIENFSMINVPGVIANTTWDYGDGSQSSNAIEENHKYSTPGFKTITLILESSSGCLDTLEKVIEVYAVPTSSFQTTTNCDNEEATTFVNQSAIDNGSILISNWSFGDGSNSNAVNPAHKYNAAGIFQAQLITVSNNGCVDTLENPVTVNASPIASFFVNSTSGCSPLCLDFSDFSTINSSAMVSQSWIFDEETLGVGANFDYCFINESMFDDIQLDMKYIVENNLGCKDTLILEDYLTVYHNPTSLFSMNPTVTNMYEREVEMVNESLGADNYLWFLEEDQASELFEPTYEYPDTGNFDVLLIAYTDNNCIDSSFQTFVIEAVENVYVPNAFTPNNDGANDIFYVSTYGIQKDGFLLRIFNRWGEQIFQSTDVFEGWNGLNKGKVCESDVYVFRLNYLDLENETQEMKGTVSLIR